MWPAIVVTVVIVLALIALAIYRVLAAKSAATKIEKGLRDQAAQHSEGIRPDMAAEIAAMESEFQKGVQALKGSAAGRSGRDALSVLALVRDDRPVGVGQDHGDPQLGAEDAGRQGGQGARRRRHAQLRLVDDQRGDPARHRRALEHRRRRPRGVAGVPRSAQEDAAQEAHQRHPAGDQRHGSAGQRGADRRAGDDAARAHRRGDRAPRDGRAGLPHHHQVRPRSRASSRPSASSRIASAARSSASACRSSASTTTTSTRSRSTSTI